MLNFGLFSSIAGSDNVDIVWFNTSDTSNFYGFKIEHGSLAIQDEAGSVPLGDGLIPGDLLTILRCNGSVLYLLNGEVAVQRSAGLYDFDIHLAVDITTASDVEIAGSTGTGGNCNLLWPDIAENYLLLEPFAHWREHRVTNDTLRLQYVERYMTNGATVHIKIRANGDGQVVVEENLPTQYGLNFHELALTSYAHLSGDASYVVTVSGINKREEYEFLMFVE